MVDIPFQILNLRSELIFMINFLIYFGFIQSKNLIIKFISQSINFVYNTSSIIRPRDNYTFNCFHNDAVLSTIYRAYIIKTDYDSHLFSVNLNANIPPYTYTDYYETNVHPYIIKADHGSNFSSVCVSYSSSQQKADNESLLSSVCVSYSSSQCSNQESHMYTDSYSNASSHLSSNR